MNEEVNWTPERLAIKAKAEATANAMPVAKQDTSEKTLPIPTETNNGVTTVKWQGYTIRQQFPWTLP